MRLLSPGEKTTPCRAAVSAMLSPREASQIAGSATPVIVFPASQGCSRSIRAISANCRSGGHITPSFGVFVQP